MIKRINYIIGVLSLNLLFVFGINAQSTYTLTLQPAATEGVDARIYKKDINADYDNLNGGTTTAITATRWTSSSQWYKERSYIKFDLTKIPENAIITSATFTMYGVSHSSGTGGNSTYLKRILTSPWGETTITWANQPTTFSESDKVTIPATTSATQNIVVNNATFKAHIQNMVSFPANNKGWMLSLVNETTSNLNRFYCASSDDANSAIRPKLEITYILPIQVSANVLHRTNSSTNNGSISLSVNGGISPYTYSWAGGQTTATLSSLTSGTYTVTVTDAGGNQAKKYFFIGAKGATSTYTITPDGLAGKDACVIIGDDGVTNISNNYGNYSTFEVRHSTSASVYYKHRSFLQYDLSSLPINSTINSATLNLYGTGNHLFNSLNKSYLKRVGNNWDEKLISWLNQPYSFESDQVTLNATLNNSTNYSLNVAAHVSKFVSNPYGNNGWVLQLETEQSASPTALSFGSSDNTIASIRPSLVFSVTIPDDCDLTKNWVEVTTFGEEGEITSQSRSYMDNLGRSTQNQSRILSANNVLASETLYDAYGRPVGTTMAAPTYTNILCYKNNFVTDAAGGAYDYNDFDLPITTSNLQGEVNNPKPIGNSTQGTLGWYYSNNNTSEPFVAASSYPYSRVEYSNDPSGQVKRASSVDDMFKMGNGHETKSYTMPSAGELDYLFGYKGTYNQNEDFTPITGSQKGENLLLYKTLSINADGKEAISYTNSSGQLIASCVSGAGGICADQNVIQSIRYIDQGYTRVHIPKSKNGSVELPLQCPVCPTNTSSFTSSGNMLFDAIRGDAAGDIRIFYKLQNAETGDFLIENTHYTINRTTRKLDFTGVYANKSLILNVAYDVPAVYKTNPLWLTKLPEIGFAYAMDYNQWSLNYYDLKGRLISSVSPRDVNCTSYFQGGTSDVVLQKGDVKSTNCISGSTSGGCTAVTPSVYAITGQKQDVTITLFPSNEDAGLLSGRYVNPPDSVVFRKSLTKALFGRLNDSLAAIDTSTYKTYVNELSINNYRATVIEPIYEDNLILLDSLGSPIDTIADSTVARLIVADTYMEFEAIVDIGFKITSTANYVYAGQYQTMKFRLAYDLDMMQYVALYDPNQMPSFYASQQLVEQNHGVGIKLQSKSIRFEGYANINNTIKYDICNMSGGPPSGSNIPVSLWNDLDWNRLYKLMINYKFVINNFNFEINPQTPTTKIKYDKYNRVIQTISQDEGQSDVVYDAEGKVRFSQNDLQRNGISYGGKFSYVNYDKRGRPTESGEYNPTLSNGAVTRMYFQTQAQYDVNTNNAPGGSTSIMSILNQADGLDDPRSKFQTFTSYDFLDSGIPAVSGASPAYAQTNTHGRVSKAWNEFGTTWYSYDETGALKWTVQNISGLGVKTYNYVTSLFGFLQQTQYQKESTTERFFHKYAYDADGRLITSHASTDGGSTWNALTKNEYYTHGPLKRTELGTGLQGIDYVYTLAGALKTINDPYLTSADPGLDSYAGSHLSFNKDVFGFSIDYYNDDYKRNGTGIQAYNNSYFGGSNNSYSGTIKSVRWRTTLPTGASNNFGTSTLMYEYNYDFNYQLKDAYLGTAAHNSGSVPSNTVTAAFTVNGSYTVNNLTYDLNGNIKTLTRKGYQTPGDDPNVLDNLTYNYSSTLKNRLNYVSDAIGTTTGSETDFPNQTNTSNYTYDVIGQLVGDVKDNWAYEYYPDGLIKNIKLLSTGQLKASFEYNHLGLRQRKITYSGGTAQTYTWYVYDPGGALASTYTTNVSTSTTSQEDLPLYAGGRVGMLNKTTNRYAFELTDHLGNVRAVVAKNASTSAADVLSYTDYYPHGGVLPGRNFVSSPSYKLGYQGQEKDAETNFSNFELRQMDARLGRWFNPDPMGQYFSPYLAMGNNPVSGIDPTGGWTETDGWGFEGMDLNSWIRMNPHDRGNFQDAHGTSYDAQNTNRIMDLASLGGYAMKGGQTLTLNGGDVVVKQDMYELRSIITDGSGSTYNYRHYADVTTYEGIGAYFSGISRGFGNSWNNMLEGFKHPIDNFNKMNDTYSGLSVEGKLKFVAGMILDEASKYSITLGTLNDMKMDAEGKAAMMASGDPSDYSVPRGERLFERTMDAAGAIPLAKGVTKVAGMLPKFIGLETKVAVRSLGAAAKNGAKIETTVTKSINQIQKLIERGKAPGSIIRADKGKIFGELDHIHFGDGGALNINGTWKHGGRGLTNSEIKFLQENGWQLPN